MDALERVVSSNQLAAIKTGRVQPYVFWLTDPQSVSKELEHFPRVRFTPQFQRQCEAWGSLVGNFAPTHQHERIVRHIALELLTRSRSQIGFTWDDSGILRVWKKH